MAKAVSIAEALAVLADTEIVWTEEQEAAIEELRNKALRQPALNVFMGDGDKLPGKCLDKSEESAEAWVELSFDLAQQVSDEIVGEVKNVQGGAVRKVHTFGIDTPHGHLMVQVKSEA